MKRNHDAVSVGVVVLLLGGITAARMTRPAPRDAEPYHQRVRTTVGAIPYRIGDWVGLDREVPPAAIRLLQPNVVLSRAYRNLTTGREATLLLVHCRDARDLAGHYPPVCYPAHGWTMDFARRRHWDVAGLSIDGMEYGFHFRMPVATKRAILANFMVLPGGRIVADIEGVRRVAADYTRHFLGAAQVQLMMDAAVPAPQREAAFQQIIGACRPAIETIQQEPTGGDPAR